MAEPPPATTRPEAATGRRRFPWPALAVLLVAVAGIFVVQFGLSGWAESDALHHDLQHGLLFICGVVAGAAGMALYRAGAPDPAEPM